MHRAVNVYCVSDSLRRRHVPNDGAFRVANVVIFHTAASLDPTSGRGAEVTHLRAVQNCPFAQLTYLGLHGIETDRIQQTTSTTTNTNRKLWLDARARRNFCKGNKTSPFGHWERKLRSHLKVTQLKTQIKTYVKNKNEQRRLQLAAPSSHFRQLKSHDPTSVLDMWPEAIPEALGDAECVVIYA